MLYTNPLVHLIVDFIVDHTVAEPNTFAYRHKRIFVNDVRKVLSILEDHGILKKRSIKIEKFKEEYGYRLLPGSDLNIFRNESNTELYYFNVDIKFIFKARLH